MKKTIDLDSLKTGMRVRYRMGIAGRSGVIFEPWGVGTLHVCRRVFLLIGRPSGVMLTVSIEGEAVEFRGSEYDPKFNTFQTEEYYMEIDPESL